MKLPFLRQTAVDRQVVNKFGGYNHQPLIPIAEWWDTQNLTTDGWPVLSNRKKRMKVRTLTKGNGIFWLNGLMWADGTELFYRGEKVADVTDTKKTFVAMGANIVVWPDKIIYNTSDGSLELMEKTNTRTSGTVTVSLAKADGSAYTGYYTGSTPPAGTPSDGDLWLDTSSTPHVMKVWTAYLSMWQAVGTTYVKIAATGIGDGIDEYDNVTISGFTNAALKDFNGDHVVYGCEADFILITGIIDSTTTQTATSANPISFARAVPNLDYVCEYENRLWGVEAEGHEIYASALGDPKNFKQYMGLSTDSYTVTVGTPGRFTGCASHLGYVLFFKDDVIHRLYGTKPANYQVSTINVRGVEDGSGRSLVKVNETLYYKSRIDVCSYATSLPDGVSDEFGEEIYTQAAAGRLGNKYYVSMKDAENNGVMFVFDTKRRIWMKEDDTFAEYFAGAGKLLYFLAGNEIWSVTGEAEDEIKDNAETEDVIEWMAESGDIGLESPDSKYISKIQLRIELAAGAWMRAEMKTNIEREWKEIYRESATSRKSFTVPVVPRRCDAVKIRLKGRGDFRLWSLAWLNENGGAEG